MSEKMPITFGDEQTIDIPIVKAETSAEHEEPRDESLVLNPTASETEQAAVKQAREQQRQSALQSVRAKLGITETAVEEPASEAPKAEDEAEQPEKDTQEKITAQFNAELREAFNRISGEVQEFEDGLRRDKFRRTPLHAEGLKMFGEGIIDKQKMHAALDGLVKNLRKDFMPEDDRDKLSIEQHNFNRLLDSLDSLKGRFIGLRSKIDKRPLVGNSGELQELSEDVGKVIVALRKKAEFTEEVRDALQRYRNRR